MINSHCFVVAAYGHSPYLEECLASIASQNVRSKVVISTSTPFEGMEGVAERYGASLYIHGPNCGIGSDWNAAIKATDCDLVTIAHQDDLYLPNFSEAVISAHARAPAAAISFCDCDEIGSNGELRENSVNQYIKWLLIALAFWGSDLIAGGARRRLLLGFGNPIFCSSVTINRTLIPDFSFREDMRTNMDWLAWVEISGAQPVRRIPHVLLRRRVHDGSETNRCISDGSRLEEDRMVFGILWRRPVSDLISFIYRLSYPGYLN